MESKLRASICASQDLDRSSLTDRSILDVVILRRTNAASDTNQLGNPVMSNDNEWLNFNGLLLHNKVNRQYSISLNSTIYLECIN